MTTNNTPDCCIGHLARIEYPSSSAKVKLHGMAQAHDNYQEAARRECDNGKVCYDTNN